MFHVAYIRPLRSVFYNILIDTHFPSMPYLSSPNPYLQSSGRISQGAPGFRSNCWRYASFSFYPSQLASVTRSLSSERKIIPGPIYNLDDYSLLNVFYLYRLACLECDDDKAYIS